MSAARRDLVREQRIERALARLDATLRQFGPDAFRWLRLSDLLEEPEADGAVRSPSQRGGSR